MKEKTLNPVWDEGFSFCVQSMDEAVMLEVWDKDKKGSDFMGEVSLGTVRQLLDVHGALRSGGSVSIQEMLQARGKSKKPAQGELHFDVQLEEQQVEELLGNARRVHTVTGDQRLNLRRTASVSESLQTQEGPLFLC